ncbi:MAG: polysaccharide deacetylase family protein [Patescibacteria group bacterium]|nr:polysaccharide deacetylase family protein [Patescibacteria group bacterium]
MKRKTQASCHGLFIIMAILFIVSFLALRASTFNQPIPDIVEMPKDVQDSIKNLKPQKSFKVPILLYHYVEYVQDQGDTIRKSLAILPYTFEEEIKTLKSAGFHFITTADLAEALDDKRVLPAKPVILTFDDGYRDFYTDVFPILKKYQVRAVVYVVPNFLNKHNNLDTWQLIEIAKSGLVEIGAHTMDHSYLTGLPSYSIKYEVEQSKKDLERIIGKPVVSFAYPYGAFNNETIDIVRKAGFNSAVTTISGLYALDVNRFFLHRIRPGGKIGQALLDLFKSESSKIGSSQVRKE